MIQLRFTTLHNETFLDTRKIKMSFAIASIKLPLIAFIIITLYQCCIRVLELLFDSFNHISINILPIPVINSSLYRTISELQNVKNFFEKSLKLDFLENFEDEKNWRLKRAWFFCYGVVSTKSIISRWISKQIEWSKRIF